MLVPTYEDGKVIETEDGPNKGYWTSAYRNLILNLLQEMQRTLSEEGFVPPSLTAADIALITQPANCQIVYDDTNNLPKICVNGVFKTIATL
jgi:hypothetical protein